MRYRISSSSPSPRSRAGIAIDLLLSVLLVGGVAACDSATDPAGGGEERVPKSNTPPGLVDDPENFLWVFGKIQRDPGHYENLLAFAQRHDLSIIMAPASVTLAAPQIAEVETALQQAKDRGVPVLFNTGVFRAADGWPTAAVIVGDAQERQAYTEALQEMARLYLGYYPGGRVIVGHEDPLFSNWPEGDEDEYRAHGAAMFQIQRAAVKAVDPEAQVGIFMLPYNAVTMYQALMPTLQSSGTLPDFNMIDLYRGYSDPSRGLEGTHEQIRGLLREIRERTNDRPTYYLGQDHTINNGYTPSKAAITGNVEAVLTEGVQGMGWYIRTRYVHTGPVSTLGGTVQPFLPTTGAVDVADYSTFTGDRDRFMFAYLATFERQGMEPAERFDLWIHGSDLDLHEARVFLRTVAGEWRFIGDIGSYVGGANEYTLDDRTGAVIFHALEREEFLAAGAGSAEPTLQVRIVAGAGSDGLEIHGALAMPYAPIAEYVTEQDAASMLATDAEGTRARALTYEAWDPAASLQPGDTLTVQ